MGINNSEYGEFGKELSAAMTGSQVLIGTLPYSPVAIIFDNQSDNAVSLYANGTDSNHLWKTFTEGEAIVLDLRSQHGMAPNFTFRVGTSFFGTGAGTGNFSISYIYAKNM